MRLFRCFLAASLMVTGLASADTYPDKNKPIRLVVPYNAGSSTDVLARALARGMSETSGVNVIVENKIGGDAVIGVQAVKTAPPDGYTILLTTISSQAVNPHVIANLPYDPIADFVPLVGVAKITLMVNLGAKTPAKTVREFIAAAKANPGKYTVGSASTTTRLAGEMLQTAAGIQLLPVPYKNFNDAGSNMVSGELDVMVVDAATIGAFYSKGVKLVAAASNTRNSRFPNVPTMAEEGVPGYEILGWFAAYSPAKTPPAIAATMIDILNKGLKTKYVTDIYDTYAMEPLDLAGDKLGAFQRAELEKWGKAVRAANMGPK
ncbi:MAG: hypothetical protein RL300_1687 [Pseudomonadota bacterium]|jgi:tripartite-type tricarboxylate transporter receptor subunit TctC